VEFFEKDDQGPVTAHSELVDWERPCVRLVSRAGAGAIPAFAGPPGAVSYAPNVQHPIQINYT
jgi:hypothetical protein